MATLTALTLDYKNLVLYICSCTQPVSLDELYFCRHCKVLRCNDCVSTVVDGSSCPHCFENVAHAEAKAKKNCCSHCFRCPLCASSLTTRFVIVPTERDHAGNPSPQTPQKSTSDGGEQEDKKGAPTPPRSGRAAALRGSHSGGSLKSPGGTKYYYLSCTHCRWTTRDVAIKDKRSPLDFKDRPHPHQERVTHLLAYYKDLEQREKADKERAKKMQARRVRGPYASLLDTSKIRPMVGGTAIFMPSDTYDPSKWDKIVSVASEPKPPPDELYTTLLKVEEVTRLEQRYLDPAQQPSSVRELWPRPLQLSGKKLHRCKGCDHILLKADLSLASVRFKIQQMALHCFPRIRLLTWPKLHLGEPSKVLLSFSNPVNYPISLSFLPCPETCIKRTKVKVSPCVLPEGRYTLTANDDVSDVLSEDEGDKSLEEDPKYVHTRQLGKVVLQFFVKPSTLDRDTNMMFVMKFTHKPLVQIPGDSDPPVSEIDVPVLVRCGHQSA